MFKIIFRIFVLLLVAGLIATGLYLLGNSAAGQSILGAGAGGAGFDRGANASFALPSGAASSVASLQAPQGGRDFGGDGGRDGISLQAGLSGLARNLGIMALITLVVVILTKTIRRMTRRMVVPG